MTVMGGITDAGRATEPSTFLALPFPLEVFGKHHFPQLRCPIAGHALIDLEFHVGRGALAKRNYVAVAHVCRSQNRDVLIFHDRATSTVACVAWHQQHNVLPFAVSTASMATSDQRLPSRRRASRLTTWRSRKRIRNLAPMRRMRAFAERSFAHAAGADTWKPSSRRIPGWIVNTTSSFRPLLQQHVGR
jgi:hypothetical protein